MERGKTPQGAAMKSRGAARLIRPAALIMSRLEATDEPATRKGNQDE
jgi:hypothetical protein